MKILSRGCLFVFSIVVLGIVILFLIDSYKPSLAVSALPKSATEIQEHYEDSFLPPDEFKRLLKARIPREEVQGYAIRVGATKKESGQAGKEFFSWSGGKEWFDPKSPPLYYHHEQEYRILVGWEDGFVYFDAVAW